MRDTVAQLATVLLLALLGALVFVAVEGTFYLTAPNDFVLPPSSALQAVFMIAAFTLLACGLFVGLPVVIVLRKLNLTGLFPLALAGATCAFLVAALLSQRGYGGLPFFLTSTFVGVFMGAFWWVLIERKNET